LVVSEESGLPTLAPLARDGKTRGASLVAARCGKKYFRRVRRASRVIASRKRRISLEAVAMRNMRALITAAVLGAAASAPLAAQGVVPAGHAPAVAPDLTATPTIYAVGYAHLDTEWRWEYPQVIREYLARTMHDNFALFEKYPDYVFNFSGANRYRLMKEYYPADYAKLTEYVKQGRWFPAGSSMEEGDVNAPSAEAIIREILYGNEYFRKDFGVASAEYMLPDCFGFPWSLPSILAYSGIKGFSTQKLVWGSSVPDQPSTPYGMEGKGVPFNVGVWVGPDGKSVVAAVNPGSYSSRVGYDLSRPEARDSSARPAQPQTWPDRLNEDKRKLGILADYKYYGTGDVGGAPTEQSVAFIQQAVSNKNPAVKVISAKADQFFLDIKPDEVARLPRYSGEMELQNHSAGSLTSQAYQKRWIRENEILAGAAELASVGASMLGARTYPMQRLNDAWTLMMGGHFHDIAAGTATPKAYEYAWNDDVIAMNQMSGIIADATSGIASALNTETAGTPIVVFNSLNVPREDVVEANVPMSGSPANVRVVAPDGNAVPAQVEGAANGNVKVVFLAAAPSMGYAVYSVQAATGTAAGNELHVTPRSLENGRYLVKLDDAGDISSIYDKTAKRELLAAPARLAIKDDTPEQWPAWNMDWSEEIKAPRAYVGGTPKIEVTENGPARVAVTITRQKDSSTFVQTVRLAAGDAGNRVEVHNVIDWHEPNATLKAMFPLTVSNDSATYNWDIGTIKRGTAYDRKFEVPSHQFIDLTDKSGAYGVTILTERKNGSDKRDDHTIGLTLLRTPGISPGGRAYADQSSQDWGHHDFVYGIAGHAGDYRAAGTDWQAWRLDAPLMSFATSKHAGALGKSFSLVRVSNPRVRVLAVKRAEASNEYVVRVVELDGNPQQTVRLSFAAPVTRAREVNGQEQPIAGSATLSNGALVASLAPFQVRSWAVTLGAAPAHAAAPTSRAVTLSYDAATATGDGERAVGGFAADGASLPAEMLPATLPYDGVTFTLAPGGAGQKNAVAARGQTISLPAGYTRAYVLAASANGDREATFRTGNRPVTLTVEDWGGYVGQWDNRRWKTVEPTAAEVARFREQQQRRAQQLEARLDSARTAHADTAALLQQLRRARGGNGPRAREEFDGLTPAFIKPASIAWYASHHHTADGANAFYEYSYLFAYPIDLPAGATTLTLPNDDAIRVLAVTVAKGGPVATPAAPLHDTFPSARR
jgi:alpha-mannosidase